MSTPTQTFPSTFPYPLGHFPRDLDCVDGDGDKVSIEEEEEVVSDSEPSDDEEAPDDDDDAAEEEEEEQGGGEMTPYVKAPKEEFGELGDKAQTEEFAEENKSVIWELLKQVSCRREKVRRKEGMKIGMKERGKGGGGRQNRRIS